MRRTFTLIFVLAVLVGGYTALGFLGIHDYWTPVRFGEQDQDKNEISISLDLDNLDSQVQELFDKGNVKESIRVLKHRLSELKDENRKKYEPKIVYHIGQGYARLNEKKAARTYFEKFLELKPETERKPQVLFEIAQTYQDREKRESSLRQAARLAPRSEVARQVAEVYGSALGTNPDPERRLFYLTLKFRHLTSSGSKERKEVLNKMKPVAKKVFRSGEPRLDATTYKVQSGDTLSEISARYNVGMGWINYTNNRTLPIRGGPDIATRLRPGDRLVVFPSPLSLDVYIGDRRLYLFYKDQYFVKSYPVGVGKGGKDETPTGTYKVTSKTKNPDWTHPETGKVLPFGHPDNIIGTRWISINLSGYGIHGIDEKLNDTIGTKSSMGCIRMKNEECEALYDIIPMPRAVPDSHVTRVRIME